MRNEGEAGTKTGIERNIKGPLSRANCQDRIAASVYAGSCHFYGLQNLAYRLIKSLLTFRFVNNRISL